MPPTCGSCPACQTGSNLDAGPLALAWQLGGSCDGREAGARVQARVTGVTVPRLLGRNVARSDVGGRR